MKTFVIIGVLSSATALVGAQATFDPSNGAFVCPPGKSAFCASGSLVSNIIIRCSGNVGYAGNCNDNLAGIPPPGVKLFAPCWQCSPTSGNAACSYAGIVYPDSGANLTIAQANAICNTSTNTASVSTSVNSTTLPVSTGCSSSSSSASASFINHAEGAPPVTITTIVETTTYMTLAMPSFVSVAPGSGGVTSGSGNSSSNTITTTSMVGTVTATVMGTVTGTGSPTQTTATGVSRTSSRVVATFNGGAACLDAVHEAKLAAGVAVVVVVVLKLFC